MSSEQVTNDKRKGLVNFESVLGSPNATIIPYFSSLAFWDNSINIFTIFIAESMRSSFYLNIIAHSLVRLSP